MRRYLTKAILTAVLFSAGTIATAPKDPHSYEIAIAAVIGAVSNGKRPHADGSPSDSQLP